MCVYPPTCVQILLGLLLQSPRDLLLLQAQSECLPANALALHRMLFSLLNTPAGFPISSQLYFENQAFRFGVQQKMGVFTELFANVDHEAAG